jgi:hypothetical protein
MPALIAEGKGLLESIRPVPRRRAATVSLNWENVRTRPNLAESGLSAEFAVWFYRFAVGLNSPVGC